MVGYCEEGLTGSQGLFHRKGISNQARWGGTKKPREADGGSIKREEEDAKRKKEKKQS